MVKIFFTASSDYSNFPLVIQRARHAPRSRVWTKRIFLPNTQEAFAHQLSLTESVHGVSRSPSNTQLSRRWLCLHDDKQQRFEHCKDSRQRRQAFTQIQTPHKHAKQKCLTVQIGHHKCMTPITAHQRVRWNHSSVHAGSFLSGNKSERGRLIQDLFVYNFHPFQKQMA